MKSYENRIKRSAYPWMNFENKNTGIVLFESLKILAPKTRLTDRFSVELFEYKTFPGTACFLNQWLIIDFTDLFLQYISL